MHNSSNDAGTIGYKNLVFQTKVFSPKLILIVIKLFLNDEAKLIHLRNKDKQ